MDALQQHGLVIPFGNRAIWTVKITDRNWSQQLSVLRVAAPTLWPEAEERPTAFSGTVTPVNRLAETSRPARNEDTGSPMGKTANPNRKASDHASDHCEIPLPHAAFSDDTPSPFHPATMPDPVFELTSDAEEITDLGKYFLQWLKGGLSSGQLPSNAVNARIHTLPQGLFLVSPGIFKDFDRQQWAKAQQRFLKLKLHQRTAAGINIWTCELKGGRGQRRLRGLLLPSPEQALGVRLPPPNPHLTLES